MMTPAEIQFQLEEVGLSNSAVVDCWRVGDLPGMDLIVDGQSRQRFDGCNFDVLAERLIEVLLEDNSRPLIMLCDLYAENNGPLLGLEAWSHKARIYGAISGIMSCLLVLIKNSRFCALLLNHQENLIIATIDDGRIVIQNDHGRKMVAFFRNNV